MKKNNKFLWSTGLAIVLMVSISLCADLGVVVKSVAFPGMGQLSDGQTTKGLSFMAAEAVLISITFGQWATMSSAEYETKHRKIKYEMGGQYSEVSKIYSQWQDAYDRTKKAQVNTIVFGGLSAGLWIVNVFDAILYKSKESSDQESLINSLRNGLAVSATPNSASVNYTIHF